MAGGAATTSGTTFQEDVGRWLVCHVLAESDTPAIAGLPGGTCFDHLVCEAAAEIDDTTLRTSDDGIVFFQAKTSLPFSANNSMLLSVFEQFAKQFVAGIKEASGGSRSVDPVVDRFVLAVSHKAPATTRDRLRDLLAKFRHCTDPATIADVKAAFAKQEQTDFETLTSLIQKGFAAAKETAPSEQQIIDLIRLVHVIVLDFGENGHSIEIAKSLLRGNILEDPARVDDAWNHLIGMVRTFGPMRTGMDRKGLRQSLTLAGFIPRPVRSLLPAIASLKSRTERDLDQISSSNSIDLRESKFRIERPVVDSIVVAAKDGNLLVLGEAGSGKSGAIYDAAELAGSEDGLGADVVVVAVDEMTATSQSEIDREFCLDGTHRLIDVLNGWSGDSPAFLFIDALDAARSSHGLQAICQMIEAIGKLAPRWHVIASMREYDLRRSARVRDLFAGEASGPHTQTEYATVRHRFVESLSDEELQQVQSLAPELHKLREEAPDDVRRLTLNPFNLDLLAAMLRDGIQAPDLSGVRTQVDLLDEYWNRRITQQSNGEELNETVKQCSHVMVRQTSLTISEADLESLHRPVRDAVNPLVSLGLLSLTEPVLAGSPAKIAFRHNILYDYGIARLIIGDLGDSVIDDFADPANHHRLFSIRPSLLMAYQRLWHANDDRKVFWERAIYWTGHNGIRPFGKLLPAEVAVDQFRTLDDFVPLEVRLNADDSDAHQLLRLVLQTVSARFEIDRDRFPLWGPSAPPWVQWIDLMMSRYPDTVRVPARTILAKMQTGH